MKTSSSEVSLAYHEASYDRTDLENVLFRNNQALLMHFLQSDYHDTFQKVSRDEFCSLDDISAIGQSSFSDDTFRCLMLRKEWFFLYR